MCLYLMMTSLCPSSGWWGAWGVTGEWRRPIWWETGGVSLQTNGPSGNHGTKTHLSQAHTSMTWMVLMPFCYIVDICCYHLHYVIWWYVCVAQDTQNPSCLKQFLDHHGLSLLWIFMVELSEAKGNSANNIKLQLEVTYVIDVALNIHNVVTEVTGNFSNLRACTVL